MEMFQASVHLKEVTLTPQEVRPPRSPNPLCAETIAGT